MKSRAILLATAVLFAAMLAMFEGAPHSWGAPSPLSHWLAQFGPTIGHAIIFVAVAVEARAMRKSPKHQKVARAYGAAACVGLLGIIVEQAPQALVVV